MALKKNIVAIVLLLVVFTALSMASNGFKKDGIVFFKGSFADALQQSKLQKKPVFLHVYATWCGPCKKLKRTSYKDAAVGAYYNKNFINVMVDGETEEGRALVYHYQVSSYPTLLIVDSNGRRLATAEGFMEPYILINFGRRVVP